MLLSVDTSTMQTGLALYDGSQVLAEMMWQSHQHHTVELAPAFTELLKRAEVKVSDIEALGVAIGPGSFTSLRVGLAFVKGLALARKLPVIGIPSLDVLATAQPIAKKLLLAALLQAGRTRIALGWYKVVENHWKLAGEIKITTVDELAGSIDEPTLVAGEMTSDERQRLMRKKVNVHLAPPSMCTRRPAVLAELAWRRWQSGKVDETASLSPIYLHTTESIQA